MRFIQYLYALSMVMISIGVKGQTTYQKFLDWIGTAYTEVVQTADSGFVFSSIFGSGITRPCLIKVNALGDTLWTRQYLYTPSFLNMENALIQTSDGGFVVTSGAMIRTDPDGVPLWARTFSGTYEGSDAIETSNGEFIVVGRVLTAGDNQFAVFRTDSAGNVLSANTFGGPEGDFLYKIRRAASGGYILAGETIIVGTNYGVLIRMDDAGNILWSKAYSALGFDALYSVHSYADGSFLAMGVREPFIAGDYAITLLKVDANGDLLWAKAYHDDATLGYNLHVTADNNIILLGRSTGVSHPVHALIINADSSGNVIWRKKFVPVSNLTFCVFNDMVPSYDGGYLISGQISGAGGAYFYNVKTDSLFNSANLCSQSTAPITAVNPIYTTVNYPLTPVAAIVDTISVGYATLDLLDSTLCFTTGLAEGIHPQPMFYPNPFGHTLFVNTNSTETAHMFLYDLAGNELLQRIVVGQETLNVETLAQGMYFVGVIQGNSAYWKKIIRE